MDPPAQTEATAKIDHGSPVNDNFQGISSVTEDTGDMDPNVGLDDQVLKGISVTISYGESTPVDTHDDIAACKSSNIGTIFS